MSYLQKLWHHLYFFQHVATFRECELIFSSKNNKTHRLSWGVETFEYSILFHLNPLTLMLEETEFYCIRLSKLASSYATVFFRFNIVAGEKNLHIHTA